MTTFVLRVWLPDRPGALGAVASRVGAVGGDVIGIDILERGADRAIDEVVVELPAPDLVPLLLSEVAQVDGVEVQDITPVAEARHDPRQDALDAAAAIVASATLTEAIDALCRSSLHVVTAAEWAVVTGPAGDGVVASTGPAPGTPELRSIASAHQTGSGPERIPAATVIWSPMPGVGLALALGRERPPVLARERRHLAVLTSMVDLRFGPVRREPERASRAGS